ncbi:MAG: TIGR03087 family PEP-CTERM/XrtA system glycosyltransferase [Candidatus Sphingomonas colombiensis]|nr:TIGR03087 family PEP-CTERM/XrtA system glycosyltransferase [Sphingomonas sp.]WEK42347.1 MAG: TIGR03087 family PEP-CTERM/XrtA system glycosyltransferase [Sphingomonas sp.]
MSEILFLAHRVPFPPDRGDKIRSFHVLRHLAARTRVHLVAFADDPRDLTPAPEYRTLVDECVVVPRTKSRARSAIEALATAQPLSLTAFAHRRVGEAVRDILARRPIDAIYVFSGQMAQYLPVAGPRAIMDFVDLDSAKFAAYAEDASGLTRFMMQREARMLAAFEREVAGRVDDSLFVSAAEAALLPGSIAIENGIDTAHYDPIARHVPVVGQGPLLVFTGQMDYRPNIDAVTWFAREMLPRIPGARFAIVGRAPSTEVRALAGERVIVTGEVADVRGWLAAASVVVAPLKLARGIQNKVLEAMAMARPVVASEAAAEGIDHDGTIDVAGDADAFVAAVNALLEDQAAAAALGKAARARVIARYDWAAALAPLDRLIGVASEPQAAA